MTSHRPDGGPTHPPAGPPLTVERAHQLERMARRYATIALTFAGVTYFLVLPTKGAVSFTIIIPVVMLLFGLHYVFETVHFRYWARGYDAAAQGQPPVYTPSEQHLISHGCIVDGLVDEVIRYEQAAYRATCRETPDLALIAEFHGNAHGLRLALCALNGWTRIEAEHEGLADQLVRRTSETREDAD
jgi:hypothetical protein